MLPYVLERHKTICCSRRSAGSSASGFTESHLKSNLGYTIEESHRTFFPAPCLSKHGGNGLLCMAAIVNFSGFYHARLHEAFVCFLTLICVACLCILGSFFKFRSITEVNPLDFFKSSGEEDEKKSESPPATAQKYTDKRLRFELRGEFLDFLSHDTSSFQQHDSNTDVLSDDDAAAKPKAAEHDNEDTTMVDSQHQVQQQQNAASVSASSTAESKANDEKEDTAMDTQDATTNTVVNNSSALTPDTSHQHHQQQDESSKATTHSTTNSRKRKRARTFTCKCDLIVRQSYVSGGKKFPTPRNRLFLEGEMRLGSGDGTNVGRFKLSQALFGVRVIFLSLHDFKHLFMRSRVFSLLFLR